MIPEVVVMLLETGDVFLITPTADMTNSRQLTSSQHHNITASKHRIITASQQLAVLLKRVPGSNSCEE